MTIRYRLWGGEHSISGPGAAAAESRDELQLSRVAVNAPTLPVSQIRSGCF